MNFKSRLANFIEQNGNNEDKVTITRTLNLEGNLNSPVSVKQRDHNSRLLKLSLKKDLKTNLDLTNTEVLLIVEKPDGIKERLDGVVTNPLLGEVVFSFTKNSLSTAGTAKCEVVRIGNESSTLSFPSFKIEIVESIYDDFLLGFGEDDFTVVE